MYLLLYVDDMLLVCKSILEVDSLKKFLKEKFGMKDLGATRKILGVEIRRCKEKSKLILSQ